MKDIEKQKYFVPLDKYAQEKVKAVYKNGILKVTIPPKEEPDQNDGIKIEIIKEEL
jgi:HSP20 family molecular chaperone IbpA